MDLLVLAEQASATLRQMAVLPSCKIAHGHSNIIFTRGWRPQEASRSQLLARQATRCGSQGRVKSGCQAAQGTHFLDIAETQHADDEGCIHQACGVSDFPGRCSHAEDCSLHTCRSHWAFSRKLMLAKLARIRYSCRNAITSCLGHDKAGLHERARAGIQCCQILVNECKDILVSKCTIASSQINATAS